MDYNHFENIVWILENNQIFYVVKFLWPYAIQ